MGRAARKFACASLALVLGLQSAGSAQTIGRDPFIFVLDTDDAGKPGTGLAWWLLRRIVRPTGTVVGGVTLAKINAELGPAADQWCYADKLTANSFVSPFRQVQKEIEASLRTRGPGLFQVSGSFTGGPLLDAVVGNYETCDGVAGAFLLITNRSEPREVLYVKTFVDWNGLIYLEQRPDGLAVSSCFECGHVEGLFYDRNRAQFYWQSLGD